MKRFNLAALGLAVLTLSGCADTGASIYDRAYVAPDSYADYSCDQLHTQMVLTTQKLNDMQDTAQGKSMFNAAVSVYAQSQGYGFDGNNRQDSDDAVELRRLKNQYDVLENTAVRKSCMHVVR